MEAITLGIGATCITGGLVGYILKKATIVKREPHVSKIPTVSSEIIQPVITYGFSRGYAQQPKTILIKAIRQAKLSLDVAVYTFTDEEIANEIVQAHRRGVKVRVLTDTLQWRQKGNQQKIMFRFVSEGIDVKMNTRPDAYMHLKVIVVDGKFVTTGSFNFSGAATKKHEEVLVRIDDAKLAHDWKRHFESMWSNQSRYASYGQREQRQYA